MTMSQLPPRSQWETPTTFGRRIGVSRQRVHMRAAAGALTSIHREGRRLWIVDPVRALREWRENSTRVTRAEAARAAPDRAQRPRVAPRPVATVGARPWVHMLSPAWRRHHYALRSFPLQIFSNGSAVVLSVERDHDGDNWDDVAVMTPAEAEHLVWVIRQAARQAAAGFDEMGDDDGDESN